MRLGAAVHSSVRSPVPGDVAARNSEHSVEPVGAVARSSGR